MIDLKWLEKFASLEWLENWKQVYKNIKNLFVNDKEFISDDGQAVLSGVSPLSSLLFVVICGVFFIFMLWILFGGFEKSLYVDGKVVDSNHYWLEESLYVDGTNAENKSGILVKFSLLAIDKLQLGQVISLSLEGAGAMEGRIIYISKDFNSKDNGYQVLVRSEDSYLETIQGRRMLPIGTILEVEILTSKQSVLDYVMKPLKG